MVAITKQEIVYPESDGKPMADNTIQFRWITLIKSNLDWLFAQDDRVFVAGDLFWYPVEKNNKKRQAPDVMVVFGRPKGDRGSYQQWKEDNIAPQVVFEILSPGNTPTEMSKKLLFYERYGVEEYYIYDPEKNELTGWLRGDDGLDTIEEINGCSRGARLAPSPRLGIRFELTQPELIIYHPNGELFSSYTEERQRADKERQRADVERQRANKLAEKLKELGVNLEEI